MNEQQIVNNIADRVLIASREDTLCGRPVDNKWYFVTAEQLKALMKSNGGFLTHIFGYEMFITKDPEKTGRQLDAHEIVSVIDTYPSYPRVIPR